MFGSGPDLLAEHIPLSVSRHRGVAHYDRVAALASPADDFAPFIDIGSA